jgi:glucosamine 6-phosphate synthetase-like amidotransferase/phosphosugar isomerase protein
MAAIKLAKEKGAFVFGYVTSLVLLSQEKLMQVLIHMGPEIGVATKAFNTNYGINHDCITFGKSQGTYTQFPYVFARAKLIQKVREALETNDKAKKKSLNF